MWKCESWKELGMNEGVGWKCESLAGAFIQRLRQNKLWITINNFIDWLLLIQGLSWHQALQCIGDQDFRLNHILKNSSSFEIHIKYCFVASKQITLNAMCLLYVKQSHWIYIKWLSYWAVYNQSIMNVLWKFSSIICCCWEITSVKVVTWSALNLPSRNKLPFRTFLFLLQKPKYAARQRQPATERTNGFYHLSETSLVDAVGVE